MKTSRLTERKILVTGGGAGIGQECVSKCLSEGATVAVLDRKLDKLEKTLAKGVSTNSTVLIEVDISVGEQVCRGVQQAAQELGGLDGVVNSAGIDLVSEFDDMNWDDWSKVLDVNLTGAIHVCQQALPYLRLSRSSSIVNIASGAGLVPIQNRVAYCASKAGLIMASKSLAMDLASSDIRVNAVCPGAVDTDLFRQNIRDESDIEHVKSRYAMNRLGEVSEIADVVTFLLSDEASLITGSALAVDGGRVFH